jgi:uncharacterized Zn finger protein
MNEEVLLTLHCPKCAELVEVVAEGGNLVCMDCGWKFDDKIAAKFLSPQPEAAQAGRENV